ncbi:MAG: hypothetical protein LBQ54_06460 [Planctomycetaceae bacterium]|jgi:hypothetical protein|nr:hypothetical protein [Planctomycetaceae bacterium]
MIDREARNELLQILNDGMDEKISPEEFAAVFFGKIARKTKDELIRAVDLWFSGIFIDGSVPCHLQSDCVTWKFFNRIRLLLESDAECKTEKAGPPRSTVRRITGRMILITLICGCGFTVSHTPGMFGDGLLIWGMLWYVLCGISLFITILLKKRPEEPEQNGLTMECYPLESFEELMRLRRSVPDFCSKRFPRKPLVRKQRNALFRFLVETQCPAWVDRIGDAFITWFYMMLFPFSLLCLWPIVAGMFFIEWKERRLILPETNQP